MTFFTHINNFIEKIYNKTIELASKPYALWALGFISFIESSFFPIPPDLILIPMVLAKPQKAFKIAFVCTISSVLGGYFGYAIGFYFYELIAMQLLDFYGYLDKFNEFKMLYTKYGAWIVAAAGMTPFPYKVITITSGVANLDLWIFSIASVLSRGFRFFLISILLYKFGKSMRNFIEKRIGILGIISFLILIGGFLLIKLL
jgi:membrane protein YqaA with SNARE-associated domain